MNLYINHNDNNTAGGTKTEKPQVTMILMPKAHVQICRDTQKREHVYFRLYDSLEFWINCYANLFRKQKPCHFKNTVKCFGTLSERRIILCMSIQHQRSPQLCDDYLLNQQEDILFPVSQLSIWMHWRKQLVCAFLSNTDTH